jgi:hypothetical protein
MQAITINTLGETAIVPFEADTLYDLLQASVDGYFECVTLRHLGIDMWVNEDGKIKQLPLNYIASAMFQGSFGNTDAIVGDVILTGLADSEGNTLGLSDEQIQTIEKEYSL